MLPLASNSPSSNTFGLAVVGLAISVGGIAYVVMHSPHGTLVTEGAPRCFAVFGETGVVYLTDNSGRSWQQWECTTKSGEPILAAEPVAVELTSDGVAYWSPEDRSVCMVRARGRYWVDCDHPLPQGAWVTRLAVGRSSVFVELAWRKRGEPSAPLQRAVCLMGPDGWGMIPGAVGVRQSPRGIVVAARPGRAVLQPGTREWTWLTLEPPLRGWPGAEWDVMCDGRVVLTKPRFRGFVVSDGDGGTGRLIARSSSGSIRADRHCPVYWVCDGLPVDSGSTVRCFSTLGKELLRLTLRPRQVSALGSLSREQLAALRSLYPPRPAPLGQAGGGE